MAFNESSIVDGSNGQTADFWLISSVSGISVLIVGWFNLWVNTRYFTWVLVLSIVFSIGTWQAYLWYFTNDPDSSISCMVMQMHNAELAYLVIFASSGLCIFIDKFFADYRLLYKQLPGDYLDEVAKWANEDRSAPREITQAQKAHFNKLLDTEVGIWEDAENKRKAEADEKKNSRRNGERIRKSEAYK